MLCKAFYAIDTGWCQRRERVCYWAFLDPLPYPTICMVLGGAGLEGASTKGTSGAPALCSWPSWMYKHPVPSMPFLQAPLTQICT